jgi:hypothetical protein
MDATIPLHLSQLSQKIGSYGKENLDDILHVLVEAITLVTRQNRCRIYLEDLTSGSLTCVAASGVQAREIREVSFPINAPDYLVSRTYIAQEEALVADVATFPSPFARLLAEQFLIQATCQFPLIRQGRAVGVVCVDSGAAGELLDEAERQTLRAFLDEVVTLIDQARKYHQQILLARRVDVAKKKEAAFYMVKSAVRLIDKVSIASVLIPSPAAPGEHEEGLQVLASYSKEKEAKLIYEDEKLISLDPGQSLLSQYINSAGVIADDTLLAPLYIPDLDAVPLQKRYRGARPQVALCRASLRAAHPPGHLPGPLLHPGDLPVQRL